MSRQHAAASSVLALCMLEAFACASPPRESEPAHAPTMTHAAPIEMHAPPPPPPPLDTTPRAPAFRVRSADGTILDSAAWLGRAPALLVFFTSWCPVCAREWPNIQRAVEHAGEGGTAVIGVALDEGNTWPDVRRFTANHGIAFPIVRGEDFPPFVRAFDSDGAFPLVVLLDKAGRIALTQRGAASDDGAALARALADAVHQAPSR